MKTLLNALPGLLQKAGGTRVKSQIIFNQLFFTIVLAFTYSISAQSQVISEQQESGISKIANETIATETLGVEVNLGAQNLSNGYGDWKDLTIRSTYKHNQHVLQAEVSANRRFNKDGLFVGVSDTYTFNDDWYGFLAVGAGDGAFYFPRYRVDGAIYRKMLPERNLVGSLGAGYYRAPDGHTDNTLSLGLAYYFQMPWILEGGVRFNNSQPGSINTRQQFVAATYGKDKRDLVIARYGWGKEGYLAIAANSQIVNFKSSEATLTWRHWFNPSTGMLLSATRYSNPAYRRTGLNIGLFTSY
jgi:YaiO family outer membrane protein